MDYLHALDDAIVTIVLVAAGYCVRVAHERWPEWTHELLSVDQEPIDAAAIRVLAEQLVSRRLGHGQGRARIQAYLDRKAQRRRS